MRSLKHILPSLGEYTPVSWKLWEALNDRGMPLSAFLPYIAYDEETQFIIMADGSIGSVIEFDLLPGETIDDSIAYDISNLVETIYSSPSLSPGTAFQVIVYSSNNYKPVVRRYRNMRKGKPFEKIIANKVKFYEGKNNGFFDDTPYTPRIFRGFITYRVFPKDEKKGFVKRLLSFGKNREEVVLPDLRLNRLNVESLMSAIAMLSVGESRTRPRLLDLPAFLDLMTEILNGEPIAVNYNPSVPLRDQILFSHLVVKNNGGIALGDRHLGVVSVRNFPVEPYIVFTENLLGDIFQDQRQLPFPFLLVLNVTVLDQFAMKAKIERRNQIATIQASGPLGALSPKKRMMAEEFQLALSYVAEGKGFIKTSMHMTIFADSEQKVREASQMAVSLFRYAGFDPFEEDAITGTVFLNSLPLGFDPRLDRFMKRGKTMMTNHIAHVSPIISDWRGTGTPAMLFFTRRGEPMFIDLFDSPGNYNLIIAAASGSGKSFLTNSIILDYLSLGGVAFILDVGKSYAKLSEVLGGEFVEFKYNDPIVLNPFTHARFTSDGISDEDLGFVVLILAKMAAGLKNELRREEEGVLEHAIVEVSKHYGNKTTITKIVEFLEKSGDETAKLLSKKLHFYTKNGKYGIFFEGDSNISLGDNRLTVIEMEELSKEKELQAVVLLMVIRYIQKAVEKRDRGERKLIIIDEAWDLLSDEYAARFIEKNYRIFRKYGASAVSITQSVNDLYKNSAGKAAIDNADFLFLLRQKAEAVEMMVREGKLSLNSRELEVLRSVRTVKGRYSEIFFYTPLGRGVGRFIADPYLYWLFTTNPKEVALIKSRLNSGETLEEAITKLAEKYPNGYKET